MNVVNKEYRPKISVIIPVYKVEEYLSQCVESVLNQTYSNLEIILIDDGSPDNCPSLCDKYSEIDSRVIVIHKENGGLSSARNIGLDIATGEIISFIDSDDWIDSDMFERMMDLKIQTGANIVSCDWISTDGTNEYEKTALFKEYGKTPLSRQITKEILLDRIGSYVWNSLYDSECWKDLRFPEGRLYEDLAVTFLAFEKADKISFLDASLYKYRINNEGISRTPNPLKYYHMFLGFLEHYDYAFKYYPEISRECCSVAIDRTILAYACACTIGRNTDLVQHSNELKQFMNSHKKDFDYRYINKAKRFALRVYYLSDSLFRFLCFIFCKTGLQKALHFDLK